MSFSQVSKQYGQTPFPYCYGFQLSNDTVNPDYVLNISPGSTVDSTVTFQMTTAETISINIANVGLNGLDTGRLATGTMYAVYLVWDPVSENPAGAVISVNLQTPVLPYGYSAYKLIGFMSTTTGIVAFIRPTLWKGMYNNRAMFYTTPIIVLLDGSATSYTVIGMAGVIPNQPNIVVSYNMSLTSVAGGVNGIIANDTAGSNALTFTTAVGGIALIDNNICMPSGSNPLNIFYSVSVGTASMNLSVYSFSYDV